MHVVVIGAVALGPKAACRFKRLMPESQVTMIDRGSRISYGGCGIPYFVSGEVSRIEELQSTPYGAVRNADFFRRAKGVDVLTRTEALAIDRKAKTVLLRDLNTGAERHISYDKLVLGTGCRPKMPPVPGIELAGISPATNLEEAESIKAAASEGRIRKAVVVGGGFIGLEMAVALGDLWGIPSSVVEFAPQLLPANLSPLLADMLAKDLTDHGVAVFCNEKVLRFEGENGHIARVVTDKRVLDADLVILSTGLTPNTELAAQAGLELTPEGFIIVDDSMRSSDPDIFSGGDCVVIRNQITGRPFWLPLGSQSNRQGRIIGTNLAGGRATFPGAVGAWGMKAFDQNVAGSGFTLAGARKAGFDAISVHVEQMDRAHFYPEHAMTALELIIERPTRRILGIQGISAAGNALTSRINAVTPHLAAGGTVADICTLELIYSPPFASAMDIINVLGNVAENVLDGRCRPMSSEEFALAWDTRAEGKLRFLDTRDAASAQPYQALYPDGWVSMPIDELRGRLAEIPKDLPLVLVCNTALRAYEAQLVLDANGIEGSRTVTGGMVAARRAGLSPAKVG